MQIDPLELENIATKNPEIVEKMKLPYFQMIAGSKNLSAQFVLEPDKKHVLDEDTKEQLKALGYIAQ